MPPTDRFFPLTAPWPSEQAVYPAIREGRIHKGVVVSIGRKKLINRARLVQWIEEGGTQLPGGWRRESL